MTQLRFPAGTLSVLGERRRVEGVIAGLQAQEPPVQEVDVDGLAELALAAEGIQGRERQALSSRSGGTLGRPVRL